jgi:hypothetical protein
METLISFLPMIGLMYLFYLVPTAFAVVAYRKFRENDEQFGRLDLLLLAVPFLAWSILLLLSSQGKSLSNAVVEPTALGMVTSIVLLLRLLPMYPRSRPGSAITIVIPVAAAFCIWLFVPGLPE